MIELPKGREFCYAVPVPEHICPAWSAEYEAATSCGCERDKGHEGPHFCECGFTWTDEFWSQSGPKVVSEESVNQAQTPVLSCDCGVEQSGSSLGS